MTVDFIVTGGGKLAAEVEGNGPLVVCFPALGDIRASYDPLSKETCYSRGAVLLPARCVIAVIGQIQEEPPLIKLKNSSTNQKALNFDNVPFIYN